MQPATEIRIDLVNIPVYLYILNKYIYFVTMFIDLISLLLALKYY